MARRNEQTRPLPDDQASLGSYQSDAYTLPCEYDLPCGPIQDDASSVYSHDSYDDSDCCEDRLASYRVPQEHGVSQPVYEAWVIYYSNTQDAVRKTTFCGLPFCTRSAESSPYIACFTQPHEQDELSDMTLSAIHRYQAANKRSLPARLVRGRTKSYEKDLDERIQTLPRAVQSELNGLLGDREAATGNRFHKRDWTVTMMRQQYRFRFANAEPEEVSPKSSMRFWKKKAAGRPSEYFFVIRGAEGKVATDNKGMQKATRHGNPWTRVDVIERDQKQRARAARVFGKNYSGNEWRRPSRSRDRSSSPPPRRVRVESEGRDSFRYPNPFTPGPPLPPGGLAPYMPLPPGPWHHPLPPPEPHAFCCPWLDTNGGRLPVPPPPPMPMGPPPPMPAWYGTGIGDFSMGPPPPLGTFLGPAFRSGLFPDVVSPGPPAPAPMPLGSQAAAGGESSLNPTCNAGYVPFDFSSVDMATPPSATTAPPQFTGPSEESRASPPPAPRLSNLTTPTTFSPASSHPTGSSIARPEAPAGRDNNIALAAYQMQLMLLEQQNKKRLLRARQELQAGEEEPRSGSPESADGSQSSTASVSDDDSA